MILQLKCTTMLFGKNMIYIIKKKDSPYYVKNIIKKLDGNFTESLDITFTDVKDLIEAKFKNKTQALENLSLLKKQYLLRSIDFELKKLNEEK